MGFWDIYLPLVFALLTMEGIHFTLGYIFAKRHAKQMKAVEEKMLAEGIDPSVFLKNMEVSGIPRGPFASPNITTASGQGPHAREEHESTGQYL